MRWRVNLDNAKNGNKKDDASFEHTKQQNVTETGPMRCCCTRALSANALCNTPLSPCNPPDICKNDPQRADYKGGVKGSTFALLGVRQRRVTIV
eukprot:1156385-Pelagomonas_calceolata.AAC.4